MALVNKTAKEGGLLPSEEAAPSVENPTKAEPEAPREPAKPKKAKEAPKLKYQDLRASVGPDSKLADALQTELDKLDERTRNFVSPVTVLRHFLANNDELLAKLFREQNSLK
jgi:hypothetical protein